MPKRGHLSRSDLRRRREEEIASLLRKKAKSAAAPPPPVPDPSLPPPPVSEPSLPPPCPDLSLKPCSRLSNSSSSKKVRIVGNDHAWNQVRTFLQQRRGGGILLLSGPSGSGKTTGVHSIATQLGKKVVEVCAPEEANPSELERSLVTACTRRGSVIGNVPTVLLLDDVDGIPERCGDAVLRFCSKFPSEGRRVVFTCSQKVPKHLSGIHSHVTASVWLNPLSTEELIHVSSGSGLPPIARRRLAEECNGDARQMKIRCSLMESCSTDGRSHTNNPFSTARAILCEGRRGVVEDSGNESLLLDLLFQNYHVSEWRDVDEMADCLSLCDTMRSGEVRRVLDEGLHVIEARLVGKRQLRRIEYWKKQCPPPSSSNLEAGLRSLATRTVPSTCTTSCTTSARGRKVLSASCSRDG